MHNGAVDNATDVGTRYRNSRTFHMPIEGGLMAIDPKRIEHYAGIAQSLRHRGKVRRNLAVTSAGIGSPNQHGINRVVSCHGHNVASLDCRQVTSRNFFDRSMHDINLGLSS